MGQGMNNFKGLMNQPKQRNLFLFSVAVGVVTIIAGLFFAGKKNVAAPSGASVASVPAVNAVPGVSDSPQYNQEVAQQNKADAANALEKNKTFLPTPVNTDAFKNSPLDDLEKQNRLKKEEEERLKLEEEEKIKLVALEKIRQEEVSQAKTTKDVAKEIVPVSVPVNNKRYHSEEDYMLVSTLMGAWANKTPKSEFNFSGEKRQQENAQASQSNSSQQQVGAVNQQIDVPPFAPAGTIYQAILETGINSDEPSPVMAKIISGPLAGSRILGGMKKSGEKIIAEFGTLSLLKENRSVKMSAVAVDPASQRTGLATEVDNHYFLKYGVLLAATFLGGYSDAIARQNTTSVITPDGKVVTQQGNLSAEDINKQAIGAVGKELAEQTRNSVRGIQPTITVKSGTAIGVLLMEDLKINSK